MPIKKGKNSITHRRNKMKDRKTQLAYMTSDEYEKIRKASELVSYSMSGFISRAALREAEEILSKGKK